MQVKLYIFINLLWEKSDIDININKNIFGCEQVNTKEIIWLSYLP